MVSELTTDHLPHQRARAFSLLPLMYGLGSIIGPMLGGFLSHPVKNYPSVFGHLGYLTEFLIEYPYFLPCFISAFICILGLVFGFFFLEETHPAYARTVEDEEERSLLQGNEEQSYSTFNSDHNTIQKSPTPTIKYKAPTLKESITPSVFAICIAYGFFAFQAIYMDGKHRKIFLNSLTQLFSRNRNIPSLHCQYKREWRFRLYFKRNRNCSRLFWNSNACFTIDSFACVNTKTRIALHVPVCSLHPGLPLFFSRCYPYTLLHT